MALPEAVLDANVLLPIYLADLLLTAGEAGRNLYVPLWSEKILEEASHNAIRLIGDREGIERRFDIMRRHLPGAIVLGYQALIPKMTNDPKDRHVLAAAVHAGASHIVTFNMPDFRRRALQPHGIVAMRPDSFLLELWQSPRTQPELVDCLVAMAQKRKRGSMTPRQLTDKLSIHVPKFIREVAASGLLPTET